MAGFDADYFASLPKMAPANQQPQQIFGSNPLVAGFVSGGANLDAALSGFGGAIGRATGITPLAEAGEAGAKFFHQGAQAVGIQNHEDNPWTPSGLAYQAAQAVPTIAGLMFGGEALAPAKAPAAMAALGRVAPRWLGGAGGAVGEVAEKAGADWARHLIGGGLAGYPVMAGGAYDQQLANGGPDQGKAALALAVGAPEAAIGAVMPAQLRALADNGLAGNLAKRVLTGGASAGAANMVQSGMTAALNQPFEDPTLSFKDRAQHIIQAALMGGAVGGLFGAAGSAMGGRRGTMETPAPAAEPAPPYDRQPSEATAPPPSQPYAFNQDPSAAPNAHFGAGGQGEMFGSPNDAVAHAAYPADEAGQLDLFQNGPQPPANPPPVGHQYDLPGFGPAEIGRAHV